MPVLNQTHEEIHHRLFGLSSLHEAARGAVFNVIQHLNGNDDWFPQSFKRELKTLQEQGQITENVRHEVERAFFPSS